MLKIKRISGFLAGLMIISLLGSEEQSSKSGETTKNLFEKRLSTALQKRVSAASKSYFQQKEVPPPVTPEETSLWISGALEEKRKCYSLPPTTSLYFLVYASSQDVREAHQFLSKRLNEEYPLTPEIIHKTIESFDNLRLIPGSRKWKLMNDPELVWLQWISPYHWNMLAIAKGDALLGAVRTVAHEFNHRIPLQTRKSITFPLLPSVITATKAAQTLAAPTLEANAEPTSEKPENHGSGNETMFAKTEKKSKSSLLAPESLGIRVFKKYDDLQKKINSHIPEDTHIITDSISSDIEVE